MHVSAQAALGVIKWRIIVKVVCNCMVVRIVLAISILSVAGRDTIALCSGGFAN
jgi:ABC-type phosphate transport system permease subunit